MKNHFTVDGIRYELNGGHEGTEIPVDYLPATARVGDAFNGTLGMIRLSRTDGTSWFAGMYDEVTLCEYCNEAEYDGFCHGVPACEACAATEGGLE